MAHRQWLTLLVAILSCAQVHAAFTLPTGGPGSFHVGEIQQNANKTWCFYPVAGYTRSATCGGNTAFVFQVHLNQSTSIGYYYPDGSRPGGADWSVPPTNPGIIFLCASGRAGDGTYLSFCAWPVTSDNNIPDGGSDCAAAVSQDTVTDGCYTPGQLPYPTDVSSITIPHGGGATATGFGYSTVTVYASNSRSPVPVSRQYVSLFTFGILVISLILGRAAFSMTF